jgi:hypothetical protein
MCGCIGLKACILALQGMYVRGSAGHRLLAAEYHMRGAALSTHVWMYTAEGLDFSLAGHWDFLAVLAITLLAADHHMPGPTLSTHVWMYRAEGPDFSLAGH